jgi:AcrR family transcriptional regulator
MMSTSENNVSSSDGRIARGERTRSSIADALYELLADGAENPSGRDIAERAQVSLRSVFQHFDDIEAVYSELITRQHERIAPFLEPINTEIPLNERIEKLIESRDSMFALAAPLRRSMGTYRGVKTSHTIRRALTYLHRAQREQILQSFAPELNGNEQMLLQLEVCLSFETWNQFTSQHGLSRAATRGHLHNLVMTQLANS